MKKRRILASSFSSLLITIALLAPTLNAQVTIGSGIAPNKGALLDLKEKSDGTSTKGLALPRVKITDVDNLYPMFTGGESDYTTQKTAHTGLWIYHVSGEAKPECAAIPDGVYVWDGTKWNGLGVSSVGTPTLTADQSALYFESGLDARGTAISVQPVNLTWTPGDLPLTWTKSDATFGGLQFHGNPLPTSPQLGGNQTFNISPDGMASTDLNPNPWRSKESTLTFEVMNACGTLRKMVTVNQTNYALQVDGKASDYAIPINNSLPIPVQVKSNAKWKATLTDIQGIIHSLPREAESGGENKTDGVPNIQSYNITPKPLPAWSTKYETATIKYEDAETPKRFNDYTVKIVQCQGTADEFKGLGTAPYAHYYNLPSGMDNRALAGSQYYISWEPRTTAGTLTKTNTLSGGVPFSSDPWSTTYPKVYAQSPNYTIQITPTAMTAAELHRSTGNPWLSKETVQKYTKVTPCGTYSQNVTLNQTNYALSVNDQFADDTTAPIMLTSTTPINLNVKGNATWSASKTDAYATIGTIATTSGGVTKKDGTSAVNPFSLTPVSGTGTKYAKASIVFSDTETPVRFKPVTLNTISCIGTADPVNAGNGGSINPNIEYFDLPSGKDARGPATAQELTVGWTPAYNPLTWQYGAHPSLNDVIFDSTNKIPASPWNTNPTSVSLLPKEMSDGELVVNPFKSYESILKFATTDACGETINKEVRLNQTNYNMKIDGGTDWYINSDTVKINAGEEAATYFMVRSNVKFKVKVPQDSKKIIKDLTKYGGATVINQDIGVDRKDGNGPTTAIYYTLKLPSNGYKYGVATIKLEDTAIPKRINDKTISVGFISCSTGVEPKMNEYWTQNILTTDINRPNASGVAWHRDQNNNLFISGDFGSAGRWMITNLAATTYAPKPRSGDDSEIIAELIQGSIVVSGLPEWIYPFHNSRARYEANERLGLQYTWAGATNSKGIANDAGWAATEKRQGICPNSWHLPSDKEWTLLENELVRNSTKYSAHRKPKNPTTNVGYEDTDQVSIYMTDRCNLTSGGGALSHSLLLGGFSALLNDYYINPSSTRGLYHTASSTNEILYTRRFHITGGSSTLYRGGVGPSSESGKGNHAAVRCVKDY